MHERDASSCHWPVGGASHQRVGFAFESLVQSAGATGDDGDADQSFEAIQLERADAAAQASTWDACPRRDEDHRRDAELEERGVVAEQRVWLRRGYDVIGCRGGRHGTRIARLGGVCGLESDNRNGPVLAGRIWVEMQIPPR